MASISNQPNFTPESILESLRAERPVDLSHLPRFDRLKTINNFLESVRLRPLEGIGSKEDGQIEFVGINRYTPDYVKPGAFVTRLDFQVGTFGQGGYNHLCYFNAGVTKHSGVVIAPVINDKYMLFVKQFRPAIGRETIEVPRGFIEDPGNPNEVKSFGAALKELKEETGVDLLTVKHEITKIVEVAENTGTSNIVNAIVVVKMNLAESQMSQLHQAVREDSDNPTHSLKSLLLSENDVEEVAKDNHTCAALYHASFGRVTKASF